MEIELITIENDKLHNFILGQTHFIKSVEDIYEAVIGSSSSIKFGLAFCEASGPCLIRCEGNDAELIDLAVKNALKMVPEAVSYTHLDLGLVQSGDEAITGQEMEKLSQETLMEKIKHLRVFARVWPEQKLNIVEALQKNQDVYKRQMLR